MCYKKFTKSGQVQLGKHLSCHLSCHLIFHCFVWLFARIMEELLRPDLHYSCELEHIQWICPIFGPYDIVCGMDRTCTDILFVVFIITSMHPYSPSFVHTIYYSSIVLNCIYIFIYIHPYSSLSNYDHSHIHLHPCIQLCLSTWSIFIFQWLSSTLIHIQSHLSTSCMCIHNSSTSNYIHLRWHPPTRVPVITIPY